MRRWYYYIVPPLCRTSWVRADLPTSQSRSQWIGAPLLTNTLPCWLLTGGSGRLVEIEWRRRRVWNDQNLDSVDNGKPGLARWFLIVCHLNRVCPVASGGRGQRGRRILQQRSSGSGAQHVRRSAMQNVSVFHGVARSPLGQDQHPSGPRHPRRDGP
ncbi:hypothetical protein N7510_002039 [Penicillium lagena]|uniref:uncharacterized protein n=1 Tax=Penicillium lagena TaxID=94218 RepID=UPI002541772D|nr:uncharacterized protein N7510_002039 [Penicillium lagena]KAJ5625730.1 hypothetical protein N7510_002039 [Penicillium lagena]